MTAIVISADGRTIISASEDKSIRAFDMNDQEKFKPWKNAHGGIKLPFSPKISSFSLEEVTCLAISPQNRFLLSGSKDKAIKITNYPQNTRVLFQSDNQHAGKIFEFLEAIKIQMQSQR